MLVDWKLLMSCCLPLWFFTSSGAETHKVDEVCEYSQPSATGTRGRMNGEIFKFQTTDELSHEVGKMVHQVVQEAKGKDKFLIALSGGSLPKLLAAGLLEYADDIDFSKWHVFFADERHVPHDHADSNLLACQQEFLAKVPGIKQEHVYGIDYSVPCGEAAKQYQQILELVTGTSQRDGTAVPRFDLILLGMGPDGHTCSLFPDHPLLQEDSVWVVPIYDSPKPPPERITLTYPVLNNAANVFFLAAGKSKEDVIPLTAGLPYDKLDDNSLPAARVRPNNGRLVWFIDTEAAGKL